MKLSNRLDTVSQLIIKYQRGRVLADIGTDHAYLPVYLSMNNYIDLGYACDVAKGPLSLAENTINKYHIKNIKPLLGSGLTPICNEYVSDISICGMGGQLITEILDEHKEYLHDKRLYLQANTANYELREYLYKNNFKIIDEAIIEDMGHIYEIEVCEYSDASLLHTELDLIFGPVLRIKKGDTFKKKWQFESSVQQRILNSVESDHPAYKKAYQYKKIIEDMLSESERNYSSY